MSKNKKNQTDKNIYEEKRKAVIIGETFTRLLNPINTDIPDLLIPLSGIPLIEFMIDPIISIGIKEIIICVRYNGKAIRNYLKKNHKEIHFQIYDSEDFTSVGDCLRKVNNEKVITKDFLLIRGLVVCNLDLDKLWEQHIKNKTKDKNCVMTMSFKKFKNDYLIKTQYDENMLIYNSETKQIYQFQSTSDKTKIAFNNNIKFEPKKHQPDIRIPYQIESDLYEAGIDICSPDILNTFTENFDYQSLRDHCLKNVLDSEIYTDTYYFYEIEKNQYCGLIRNTESYLKISMEIVNRWGYPMVIDSMSISSKLKINFKIVDFCVYSDKANSEENYSNAKRLSSVVLGKNISIGKDSSLNFVVLDQGVSVGKNCELESCIIFPGVKIEDNVKISKSIICAECIIKEGVCITSSFIGKEITVEEDKKEERVMNYIDPDTNEKTVDEQDKDLFFKNLEDNEIQLLPKDANYLGEEDNNDSDSDNEEESSDKEDKSEEEDYENELSDLIANGLNKKSNIEDLIKEIVSYKLAYWEKTYAETLKICLSIIINDFMNDEMFNHNHITPLTQLFKKWEGLFQKMIPNPNAELQFISVLEKLCMDIPEITDAFHIILQILNSDELNIIKNDAIKQWYNNNESFYTTSVSSVNIPDDIHKNNLDKMKLYIDTNM